MSHFPRHGKWKQDGAVRTTTSMPTLKRTYPRGPNGHQMREGHQRKWGTKRKSAMKTGTHAARGNSWLSAWRHDSHCPSRHSFPFSVEPPLHRYHHRSFCTPPFASLLLKLWTSLLFRSTPLFRDGGSPVCHSRSPARTRFVPAQLISAQRRFDLVPKFLPEKPLLFQSQPSVSGLPRGPSVTSPSPWPVAFPNRRNTTATRLEKSRWNEIDPLKKKRKPPSTGSFSFLGHSTKTKQFEKFHKFTISLN